MENRLVIEIIRLLILAGAIITLVYFVRDKMNWKIATAILIIASYAFPTTELFADNFELSAYILVHLLIYTLTIIISVVIVDRYRNQDLRSK